MKAPYWVVKSGAVYLVAALHSTWVADRRKATKFLNRDHAVAWKGDATRIVRVVPKRRESDGGESPAEAWERISDLLRRERITKDEALCLLDSPRDFAARLEVLEAQVRSLQLAQPRGIKHADKA